MIKDIHIYTLVTYIGVWERAYLTILIVRSDGEQGTDTCICYLGVDYMSHTIFITDLHLQ